MNSKLELNEIKEIEIGILKHFKSFCEQEGLQYFLSNGTLLGAVKYGGFIPWDDDIDVMMPREDYDRFISIYEDTDKYRLFSPERNDRYKFPFAKLCDTGTVKEEFNIDNGTELGLEIDIFPLDNWENGLEQARGQASQIHKCIGELMFLKHKKSYSSNFIKRIGKAAVLAVTRSKWKDKVDEITAIASSGRDCHDPQFKGCVIWCVYGEKEIIPAEVFEKTVSVTFEGMKCPAPAGYDIYLRSLYGDYRMDPPADKQKTHHNFTAWKK